MKTLDCFVDHLKAMHTKNADSSIENVADAVRTLMVKIDANSGSVTAPKYCWIVISRIMSTWNFVSFRPEKKPCTIAIHLCFIKNSDTETKIRRLNWSNRFKWHKALCLACVFMRTPNFVIEWCQPKMFGHWNYGVRLTRLWRAKKIGGSSCAIDFIRTRKLYTFHTVRSV